MNGEAESKSVSTRIAEARKLQCERREHRSQLLGGFAGRFYSKDFRTPTFPQVSGTRAAQRPQRTAQKSGTHGKIGAHFLQNRPEVGGIGGVLKERLGKKRSPTSEHISVPCSCAPGIRTPPPPACQQRSRQHDQRNNPKAARRALENNRGSQMTAPPALWCPDAALARLWPGR